MSDILTSAVTEARNPASVDIDAVSTLALVRIINREDARVIDAIASQAAAIAEAIDGIAARMRTGGRLIYVGAGTSGRLGVLDASECPPTFNTAPEQVIGVIAGGERALTQSSEASEDSPEMGAAALAELDVSALDSVVGIAASGRTPFTLGAMEEAKHRGALVISLACNHPSPMASVAEIVIAPVVGPEALTGSTRLKSGSAQKMVLNMLSTGVMIRLGKTYSNLMVDVRPTNEKLRWRAQRIVAEATGLDQGEAAAMLDNCDGEVKTAIVAVLGGCTPVVARARLVTADGVVRAALEQ